MKLKGLTIKFQYILFKSIIDHTIKESGYDGGVTIILKDFEDYNGDHTRRMSLFAHFASVSRERHLLMGSLHQISEISGVQEKGLLRVYATREISQ